MGETLGCVVGDLGSILAPVNTTILFNLKNSKFFAPDKLAHCVTLLLVVRGDLGSSPG